ncbi:MAG: hypothetical protein JWO81_1395 [Alphaproteobacteria bacterium]|nr:hypothetical protein [Alphaproteobacteria bacterium]
MATLGELQTRIVLDTNRDDLGPGGELAQALTDAIADAIETYADEPFWFNRAAGNIETAAGAPTAALPAGMRAATLVARQGAALRKVPLESLQGRIETGPPCRWAEDGGALHFWPMPDAAYTLDAYGIADLGVPADPSAANGWTEEAYRLILGAAKKILARGALRDADGLALARDEEEEALAKLRRETRRRAASGLASDLPGRAGFSITAGR